MEINRILIIFKTHLDIGFTDFAADVKEKYLNVFIPNALKTAKELRESGTPARMKWTTGSWLIWEYLRRVSGTEKEKELFRAVEAGDICWHALPCTTHTELMDKELFEYGLSLSRRLDRKYGGLTHGAKMTDVPGHTKAMIPLLKKAGINFLHIGVNEASAVPDVPGLFRWQCDSGESINVMYEGSYGDFREIGNSGVAVVFAHTSDNMGCQSATEVIALFERLRKEYPKAEITAATLDDVADEVYRIQDTLPVVTSEIGDSWIHGAGTDPTKTRTFRALETLMEEMPEGDDRETLSAGLLMIPEHTWGCDEKTWLRDNVNYKREITDTLMDKPNYRKMIDSWQEQRRFMTDAVSKLSPEWKEKAEKAIDSVGTYPVSTEGMKKVNAGDEITLGQNKFRFNEKGECVYYERKGTVIADDEHRLFSLMYERFSHEDYNRFRSQYHRISVDWAIEDFTKIGMESASPVHKCYFPAAEVFADSSRIVIRSAFTGDEHTLFGAPSEFTLEIWDSSDGISAALQWKNKPATRVAEAIWLGMHPIASGKRISKLGTLIDPCHVVSRGGRGLAATDRGVFWKELSVESRDAVLVAPGRPCLTDFNDKLPTDEEGVHFNLYNNVWGTNFPMWFGEDALFRFNIREGK